MVLLLESLESKTAIREDLAEDHAGTGAAKQLDDGIGDTFLSMVVTDRGE
jgi:hypothetical protein